MRGEAGGAVVRLTNHDRQLWESFQERQASPQEMLASPVLRRWRRARDAGAPAAGGAGGAEVSRDELRVRREKLRERLGEGVLQLARYEGELAERGVVGVVADAEAVILTSSRGGDFAPRAAEARLVPGVRWDEASQGTNAIGTVVAEGAPVAVVGGAHYAPWLHSVFCYGVPVFDPFGELVAVLDVTGPVEQERPDIELGLLYTSAALEHGLRLRAYSHAAPGGLSVLKGLMKRANCGALLVESPGRVVMASRESEPLLRGETSRPLSEVLDVSWETLSSAALQGRALRASGPTCGEVVLKPEPIVDARRRVLAVLAYTERLETRGRPLALARGGGADPFDAVVGSDARLEAVKALAQKVAQVKLPVLILAETGTGKELFARAIHRAGPRASRPFVAVNCGSLSATLLESELFGYAKGAFTGARREGHEGKLAAAEGGTLFLDEVADMPEPLQNALLRVLEDGSYYRVGDNSPSVADVRVICATGRDLVGLVRKGAFRKDLFYRINGACIRLPRLADRTDREELAEVLLGRLAAEAGVPAPPLGASARAWIRTHSWPGNVRELRMALQHALLLARDEPAIEREHMPADPFADEEEAPSSSTQPLQDPPRGEAAEPSTHTRLAAERSALEEALKVCGANVSDVARRLGVARSTVYRLLARHRPDLLPARRTPV